MLAAILAALVLAAIAAADTAPDTAAPSAAAPDSGWSFTDRIFYDADGRRPFPKSGAKATSPRLPSAAASRIRA